MKNLYMMCGIPGSGKSTYVATNFPDATVISRDAIRFALLKEGDDYFAYEDTVLQIFYTEIQNAIDNDKENDIIIDATHLTPNARATCLKELKNLDKVNLVALSIEVPLAIALYRNNKRTGRARVPDTVIRNMYKSYKVPIVEEGFNEVRRIVNE
jgi:predicted kinase